MSMDRWRKRAHQAEFERDEQKAIVAGLRKQLAKAETELKKTREKVAA